MGRSTFTPVTVSILAVSAPTVFRSGRASSYDSSVLRRRHLYKNLLDSKLIGADVILT